MLKKVYTFVLLILFAVILQEKQVNANCPGHQEAIHAGNPHDPDSIEILKDLCDTLNTCYMSGGACCCYNEMHEMGWGQWYMKHMTYW